VCSSDLKNTHSTQDAAGLKVVTWGFTLIRSLFTFILLGLLLAWLLPSFIDGLSDKLRSKPWPSLWWGIVTCAGFLFSLLIIVFVTILGAILFGILTLGGLSAAIIGLGVLAFFAIILAFLLAVTLMAKIVFGMTLGNWILVRINPPLARNKYWSIVIGIAITVITIAVLTFPLIPGFLGSLLNILIVLFGLGAIWLWVRDGLLRRSLKAVS
jgi:hypothetical protein